MTKRRILSYITTGAACFALGVIATNVGQQQEIIHKPLSVACYTLSRNLGEWMTWNEERETRCFSRWSACQGYVDTYRSDPQFKVEVTGCSWHGPGYAEEENKKNWTMP